MTSGVGSNYVPHPWFGRRTECPNCKRMRALLAEVAGRGRLDASDELQDRIKAALREDGNV